MGVQLLISGDLVSFQCTVDKCFFKAMPAGTHVYIIEYRNAQLNNGCLATLLADAGTHISVSGERRVARPRIHVCELAVCAHAVCRCVRATSPTSCLVARRNQLCAVLLWAFYITPMATATLCWILLKFYFYNYNHLSIIVNNFIFVIDGRSYWGNRRWKSFPRFCRSRGHEKRFIRIGDVWCGQQKYETILQVLRSVQ